MEPWKRHMFKTKWTGKNLKLNHRNSYTVASSYNAPLRKVTSLMQDFRCTDIVAPLSPQATPLLSGQISYVLYSSPLIIKPLFTTDHPSDQARFNMYWYSRILLHSPPLRETTTSLMRPLFHCRECGLLRVGILYLKLWTSHTYVQHTD